MPKNYVRNTVTKYTKLQKVLDEDKLKEDSIRNITKNIEFLGQLHRIDRVGFGTLLIKNWKIIFGAVETYMTIGIVRRIPGVRTATFGEF